MENDSRGVPKYLSKISDVPAGVVTGSFASDAEGTEVSFFLILIEDVGLSAEDLSENSSADTQATDVTMPSTAIRTVSGNFEYLIPLIG